MRRPSKKVLTLFAETEHIAAQLAGVEGRGRTTARPAGARLAGTVGGHGNPRGEGGDSFSGRRCDGGNIPQGEEMTEPRYRNYSPEVNAILDVARSARHLAKTIPGTFPDNVIQHLEKPAQGWWWSLIDIILDYEDAPGDVDP